MLLLQEEMNVEIAITLCRHNIEEIPSIIQFCKENGVAGVQINRLVTVGRGSHLKEYTKKDCAKIGQMISEISREYKGYVAPNSSLRLCHMKYEVCSEDTIEATACGAGFSFCCVLWNGDVTPCLLMRDVVFGNITEKPLSEIWRSSPQLKAFRSAFSDPGIDVICNACEYNHVCGRGCRAQAYHTSGMVAGPDPICSIWGD